jgi:aarF domain-containing kinase
VRQLAEKMGYINPGNSDEYVGRILNLILLVSEPVIKGGVYDFRTSDVFSRGRDAGLEMFFEDLSEYRVPPPETMFLHRKLVGSFMLCSRIGSRVNVQELLSPFLPPS